MGGGSILVGKSKNFEVFIEYATPCDDKQLRGFRYRKKSNDKYAYANNLYEDMAMTPEIQQMLEEFEEQQTRMRNADTLESLFPILDTEKLTLAEIYRRMVKAENSIAVWKKRAEEAEGLLYEIGEFHEKLVDCEHEWEPTDNQGHSMKCTKCGEQRTLGAD